MLYGSGESGTDGESAPGDRALDNALYDGVASTQRGGAKVAGGWNPEIEAEITRQGLLLKLKSALLAAGCL